MSLNPFKKKKNKQLKQKKNKTQTDPTPKKVYKKLPEFPNEMEEKIFWETHNTWDFINWDNAEIFVKKLFKNEKDLDKILDALLKKDKFSQ